MDALNCNPPQGKTLTSSAQLIWDLTGHFLKAWIIPLDLYDHRRNIPEFDHNEAHCSVSRLFRQHLRGDSEACVFRECFCPFWQALPARLVHRSQKTWYQTICEADGLAIAKLGYADDIALPGDDPQSIQTILNGFVIEVCASSPRSVNCCSIPGPLYIHSLNR